VFTGIGRTSLSLALFAVLISTIGCDRLTKHVASTTLPEGQVHSYLADTVRLVYVDKMPASVGNGGRHAAGYRPCFDPGCEQGRVGSHGVALSRGERRRKRLTLARHRPKART
jgi:hypothetical protein